MGTKSKNNPRIFDAFALRIFSLSSHLFMAHLRRIFGASSAHLLRIFLHTYKTQYERGDLEERYAKDASEIVLGGYRERSTWEMEEMGYHSWVWGEKTCDQYPPRRDVTNVRTGGATHSVIPITRILVAVAVATIVMLKVRAGVVGLRGSRNKRRGGTNVRAHAATITTIPIGRMLVAVAVATIVMLRVRTRGVRLGYRFCNCQPRCLLPGWGGRDSRGGLCNYRTTATGSGSSGNAVQLRTQFLH